MNQWGIFNDESCDYSEIEAIEADFYSKESAEAALAERYADDDCCFVHLVEEPDDEEDEEDEEEFDDDEQAYKYDENTGPTPY